MRRDGSLALLFVAAAVPSAAAQGEGYTLRIKERLPGETVYVAKDEAMSEMNRVVGPMQTPIAERTNLSGERTIYRETILEVNKQGVPIRLRRTYEQAQMREKNGRLRPLVYHGKTVTIERKGPRATFWLEGRGELTPAEAKLLDTEFNRGDERFTLKNLMPPGPVRAGDYPWNVDAKPLARDLQRTGKIGVDLNRAKGTGRLTRVYRDDQDRVCGELQFQLEFPITMLMIGSQKTAMGPGSRSVVDITLQMCIDGSSYYLANKDAVRIEAATGYRLPDGSPSIFQIVITSNNTCIAREEPRDAAAK